MIFSFKRALRPLPADQETTLLFFNTLKNILDEIGFRFVEKKVNSKPEPPTSNLQHRTSNLQLPTQQLYSW